MGDAEGRGLSFWELPVTGLGPPQGEWAVGWAGGCSGRSGRVPSDACAPGVLSNGDLSTWERCFCFLFYSYTLP